MDWSNIGNKAPTKKNHRGRQDANNANTQENVQSSSVSSSGSAPHSIGNSNVTKACKNKSRTTFTLVGGAYNTIGGHSNGSSSNIVSSYTLKPADVAEQSLRDRSVNTNRVHVLEQLQPHQIQQRNSDGSFSQIQILEDTCMKVFASNDGEKYMYAWLNFNLDNFLKPDGKVQGVYKEVKNNFIYAKNLTVIGWSLFKHLSRNESCITDIISPENRIEYDQQAYSEQKYNPYNIKMSKTDIQACNELAVQLIEAITSNATNMEFEAKPQLRNTKLKNPRVTIYANSNILPAHMKTANTKPTIGFTYEIQTSNFLFFNV